MTCRDVRARARRDPRSRDEDPTLERLGEAVRTPPPQSPLLARGKAVTPPACPLMTLTDLVESLCRASQSLTVPSSPADAVRGTEEMTWLTTEIQRRRLCGAANDG